MTLRTVAATRYVTPLREGGSLPAIVEADDDGLYVLKFRGAGQGAKALIAELIGGELARATGLRVPELVFVQLDPDLARTEPDPEIQDLIRASAGLNLALDYLPGSVTFDPVAERPDPLLASRIVCFDALVMNVDRTPRNTNMLLWHKNLWLIDHGSALYLHHADTALAERWNDPFALIRDHVLLPFASALDEAASMLQLAITPDLISSVLDAVPDEWLEGGDHAGRGARARHEYAAFLSERSRQPGSFIEEARRARAAHV